MPHYFAGLCSVDGEHLIPFDTLKIIATEDDEAVQKAVEWQANTLTAIEGETWLQVTRDGELIYSKPVGPEDA
jgi:putative SOS response-associated peptidase YedK